MFCCNFTLEAHLHQLHQLLLTVSLSLDSYSRCSCRWTCWACSGGGSARRSSTLGWSSPNCATNGTEHLKIRTKCQYIPNSEMLKANNFHWYSQAYEQSYFLYFLFYSNECWSKILCSSECNLTGLPFCSKLQNNSFI